MSSVVGLQMQAENWNLSRTPMLQNSNFMGEGNVVSLPKALARNSGAAKLL